MSEQLSMFEPSGLEVLHLAGKYTKDAERLTSSAALWAELGFIATSNRLYSLASDAQRKAAEMHMLAEFESLGGVHS